MCIHSYCVCVEGEVFMHWLSFSTHTTYITTVEQRAKKKLCFFCCSSHNKFFLLSPFSFSTMLLVLKKNFFCASSVFYTTLFWAPKPTELEKSRILFFHQDRIFFLSVFQSVLYMASNKHTLFLTRSNTKKPLTHSVFLSEASEERTRACTHPEHNEHCFSSTSRPTPTATGKLRERESLWRGKKRIKKSKVKARRRIYIAFVVWMEIFYAILVLLAATEAASGGSGVVVDDMMMTRETTALTYVSFFPSCCCCCCCYEGILVLHHFCNYLLFSFFPSV